MRLDAAGVDYISSTGLRVLLRLVKSGQADLTVCNASPGIYDVYEITGMTSLMKVQKRMREVRVDGCEVIGRGAYGTVYRLDSDTIVKVYRNGEASLPVIEAETARARQAFVSGVPTAIPFDIVRVGDQYGSVFEMIDARNCNDLASGEPGALDDLTPSVPCKCCTSFTKRTVPLEIRFAYT